MSQSHNQAGPQLKNKTKLPILDVEAELKKFEEEERKRLGLDKKDDHWTEDMADLIFTKSEKPNITILVGGLTVAHDFLVEGGLRGVGYNVQMMDPPNNDALQFGKEFGNRGQCNPTYFTVGNLIQTLTILRDKHGLTNKQIVDKYVFLTAGACGPCRFGMYVTEYRKALRDAGFDGFRVMLFQQKGGLKQATGEESGLEMVPKFFLAIIKAMVGGDVLNALGYRLRPFEINVGETDRALEKAKQNCYDALLNNKSILHALWKSKPLFDAVKVDRMRPIPKVSIIGEFWAMTTEGDGNYQLQRFLEGEGAECDIQLVTAWILYTVWESQNDTKERMFLSGQDKAKYGLDGAGAFGAMKTLVAVNAAEYVVRALFQVFAHAGGLYGYKLPDMKKMAEISHEYYNNDLRGGEGHMEVGKLIMNVLGAKAHMTLSVKPFGCMPSAGVSDGVQSAISEKFPGTIFCPVETSGDGRVNFYSRVQMYLFKAKQAAVAEYERALEEHGLTREEVKTFLEANPKYARSLHKPAHAYAGICADIVAEIAPLINMTPIERFRAKVTGTAKKSLEMAQKSPHLVVELVGSAVREAPVVARKLREDVLAFRDERAAKKKAPREDMAHAAE